MLDHIRKRLFKVGDPPGTLTYVGPKRDFTPEIELVSYSPTQMDTVGLHLDDEAPAFPKDRINLLNVTGIHDPELVRKAGGWLGLHHLNIEDILNTGQRPKLEEDDDEAFLVVKAVEFDPEAVSVGEEQVSVFWKKGAVAVFQELPRNVLAPLLKRLARPRSRIRSLGPDYMAFAILDAIVDRYFPVLGRMAEMAEELEFKLQTRPTEEVLQTVFRLRRAALALRNSLWPVREITLRLSAGESEAVGDDTVPYLRDVHDHVLQAVEAVDSLHSLLAGLIDLHISLAGMRMNSVMKVLTIVATIFIPLTFVAGIYGMNFQYMPELAWKWGYFAVLGGMTLVAGCMVLYFLKKKWF